MTKQVTMDEANNFLDKRPTFNRIYTKNYIDPKRYYYQREYGCEVCWTCWYFDSAEMVCHTISYPEDDAGDLTEIIIERPSETYCLNWLPSLVNKEVEK